MTTQAQAQAAAQSTPAAGAATAAAGSGTQPGEQATGQQGNAVEEGRLREIERLREKNRALEAEKADRERVEKEAADAALAEKQQFKELADKRKIDLEAKDRELAAERAKHDRIYIDAQLRARRHELIDPEDLALFDAATLVVKDGEVQDLDAKWADFKKRKPHIFKAAGGAAPPGARPAAVHPGGTSPAGTGEAPKASDFPTTEAWETHLRSLKGK